MDLQSNQLQVNGLPQLHSVKMQGTQIDTSVQSNLQLRGGTSGVHARKLSDIEELKVKTKSLSNKYQESRRGIAESDQNKISLNSNLIQMKQFVA